MTSIVADLDNMRSMAFGSISASYLTLGSAFTHPMRIVKIVNNTNADIIISTDGVNNKDYVPLGAFTLYDLTANQNETAGWYFKIGTQFYIKYATAQTSGSVFLVAIYGEGE